MATLQLAMTKTDLMNWGFAFSRASKPSPLSFIHTATQDYASFRCLLFNNMLANSLVMAAQAVEKMLKAHLAIEQNGTIPRISHDLVKAAALLQNYKPSANSLKLYSFLMDVYELNRYPDNLAKILAKHGGRFSQSGAIVSEIDEEIFALMDSLPASPEVKYRSWFFTAIFDDQSKRNCNVGHFITLNNQAFLKKAAQYEDEFFQVFYFHYPTLKPQVSQF